LRSIFRFLRLALAPGNRFVNAIAYAVIGAAVTWQAIDRNWLAAGLILAGGAAALLLVGGIRLQRRFDKEPLLSLSFDPTGTPICGVPLANWPGGATGSLWHLLAVSRGAVAREAAATLADLQIAVGSGYRRHPNWSHSFALKWAGPASSTEIQLNPEDPRHVELGFTLAGGNLFYLGSADEAPDGQLLGVGAGAYRVKVILRAANAEHNPAVHWFDVRYDGSSVAISELAEQP
jgi:hypothetical protein